VAGPAPTLDGDGDSIRAVAGGRGPPRWSASIGSTSLDGVQVVEFATFFAAPYGHRLLSDLGADVIKVEAWPAIRCARWPRSSREETGATTSPST
jgi:crotonobetainyl-CoA:carnitine CoA-transferase CaiB-like acyl-CoA transferase